MERLDKRGHATNARRKKNFFGFYAFYIYLNTDRVVVYTVVPRYCEL